MGHQVIKLQNPLKTLGFLQFYRFKTVKDRIIDQFIMKFKVFLMQSIFLLGQKSFGTMKYGSLTVSFQIHFAELQYAQGFKPSFFVKFNAFLCSVCSVIVL